MPDIIFRCPSCGKQMQAPPEKAGAKGKCRGCSASIVVPQPAPGIRTDSPSSSGPKQGLGEQTSSSLPERMRANRVVAGKTCPRCTAEIELGDPVVNCQKCGASSHEHCYDVAGGCPSPGCRMPMEPPPLPQTSVQTLSVLPDLLKNAGLTTVCPYCGETILANARKCRFCNEFLDEALRAANEQKKNPKNDDLTTGDIIFCILCSGIACIFGLVYAIQGKKKGWKMVGLSFAMSVFWTIIRLILEEM